MLAEGDPDAPDAVRNNTDVGMPVFVLNDIEEEDDEDDNDEDPPLPTKSPRDK